MMTAETVDKMSCPQKPTQLSVFMFLAALATFSATMRMWSSSPDVVAVLTRAALTTDAALEKARDRRRCWHIAAPVWAADRLQLSPDALWTAHGAALLAARLRNTRPATAAAGAA